MTVLSLFIEFFKIGMFSFGGGHGAIPLIQEKVLQNGWMSSEMFSNVIAISESTPGPIMVNAATYIGNIRGGIPGALAATIAVVLPAFFIMIGILVLFQNMWKKPEIQMALSGIKPCIMGIVTAAGVSMLISCMASSEKESSIDLNALMILIILAGISVICFYKKKTAVSLIALIAISAVLGVIFF